MYRLKGRKVSKTIILVWFLFGILLSTIAIQIRLSGKVNLNQFYDVGRKYIVSYEYYTKSYDGCEYQADGCYHILQDDVSIPFYVNDKKNRPWRYIYLDIRDLNQAKLPVEVAEFRKNGKVVFTREKNLTAGMNKIRISKKKSSGVVLRFKNQAGAVFRIHSMQFRIQKSYYGTAKVALMMLFCMAVYGAASLVAYMLFIRKLHFINVYVLMDILTGLYGGMTAWMPAFNNKLNRKVAGILRVICFLLMIFGMLYTEDYGSYNNKNYYHIFLLLNCVIVLFLTVLSMERQREKVNWKNPMIFSWVIYCVLACISDVILPKNQMFTGVMMLIFYGMFYYALAGMGQPVKVMHDFMVAVEISYVITTFFCLFCRPLNEMVEGRYIGCTISPYSYALYVGIVLAVFFAELDRWLLERRKIRYLVFYLIGIVSGLYFVWLTQSRDGVLAVFLCGILFMLRAFLMRKESHYGRKTVFAIVLCVILVIPTLWIQDWCVQNLPEKLSSTIYFENDSRMIRKQASGKEIFLDDLEDDLTDLMIDDGIVYAQEIDTFSEKRHVLEKAPSLDILSSGRITIYKEYIAIMNLWGHETSPIISGRKMNAHNAVLQTGYRYGIFSMIPYTVMLLYVIYYSCRYLKENWHKKQSYAFLPMALISAGFVMMMFDNVERNYRYLPWISFYLLIGFLSSQGTLKGD